MPRSGSNDLNYNPRPRILLDGNLERQVTDDLLSLKVHETTMGLACCEITLANLGEGEDSSGYNYFQRDILDFGKKLVVETGEEDTRAAIFAGRIMALEAHYPHDRSPEMLILAEDTFQDLRMRRRTRTFSDVSDDDVFEQIAGEHGLTPELDLTGPVYSVLAQVNQSDLAFLRSRARAIDAELWIDDASETLFAQARSRRQSSELSMSYGGILKDLVICADLACQQTAYTISGWDVAAKAPIRERVDDSVLRSELKGSLSGSQILQATIGPRKQSQVHTAPLNTNEARALAEANYKQSARRFVTGRGVCEGDGRLRVGTKLQLERLGKLFDGAFYVTEVSHIFDPKQGYYCEFKVEKAGINSI